MAAIVALAALGQARSAAARARGIVSDSCQGCHDGGAGPPELTLTAAPTSFDPGDTVTFTLRIQESSIRVGGAFITTSGVGTLEALSGEGLAVNAQGLTHTAPKAVVGDSVTFQFAWRAPATPGGVDFFVAAVAANGNNASMGDSPGAAWFHWAYGCTGRSFYQDLDRDGYGSENLGTRIGCDGDPAPAGFAAMDGDCDENSEKVHPGATEVCNRKDDDCNGQTDENAPAVMMWPDGDGDGYYKSQTGTPQVGCGDLSGFAAVGGDCDDTDPAMNPGAAEICNSKDDDCDGEVDDHVRPQCGVGWCARYSSTCDPADCEPGPPAVETCNAFDDDCDGENDNDACSDGMLCLDQECVANGEAPTSSGGAAGAASAAAGPVTGTSLGGGSSIPVDANAVASAETSGGGMETISIDVSSDDGPSGGAGSVANSGLVVDSGPSANPDFSASSGSSPPDSAPQGASAGRADDQSGCSIAAVAPARAGEGPCAGKSWAALVAIWLGLGLLRRTVNRRDWSN